MDPQPSRWYMGQSPDSGDPAGYPARGDDHPDKPHLRVFPRHGTTQVEEVFQETRPIWLTENMAANMHSIRFFRANHGLCHGGCVRAIHKYIPTCARGYIHGYVYVSHGYAHE